MSNVVENRVVEMQFDNSKFEKNIDRSIESLDRLKESLDFNSAVKKAGRLDDVFSGLRLDKIADDVEALSKRFSALGIVGMEVFRKLTNSAIEFGKAIKNSLTRSIREGFQEYELKMDSVQTILSNVADEGKTLTDVTAALDQLNEYADKTIYKFSDMTTAIKTFTTAGVDLDSTINAVQGIANVAAFTGASAEQAASAYYMLSQSLNAGYVSLYTFRSLERSGMGGESFQREVMETARVHGVAIDEIIAKNGSFRESLKEGWLTRDLMIETLAKYTGQYTDEAWKAIGYTDEQIAHIQQLGVEATNAATKVKTFTQLIDTLKEALGTGWATTWETVIGNFEEARELFTGMSDFFGELINRSSDARNAIVREWKELGGRDLLIESFWNVVKAIGDFISPIKEAFDEIFGVVTAEKLMAITRRINEFTKSLRDADGRLVKPLRNIIALMIGMTQIAKNLVDAIKSIITPIKEVIMTMLKATDAYELILRLTDFFMRLTHAMILNGEAVENLKKIFGGFLSIFSSIKNVGKWLYEGIVQPILEMIFGIGSSGMFDKAADAFANFFKKVEAFTENLPPLKNRLIGFIDIIKTLIGNIKNFIGTAWFAIADFFQRLTIFIDFQDLKRKFKELTTSEGFAKFLAFLDKAANALNYVWDIAKKVGKGIFEALGGTLKKLGERLKNGEISEVLDDLLKFSKSALMVSLSGVFIQFIRVLGELKEGIEKVKLKSTAKAILLFAASLLLLCLALKEISTIDVENPIKQVLDLITLIALVGSLTGLVATVLKHLPGADVTKMFGFILAIGIAVKLLTSSLVSIAVLGDKAGSALVVLMGMMALLGLVLVAVEESMSDKDTIKSIGVIISFAAACKTLAKSLRIISDIDGDKLTQSFLALIGILTGLLGITALLTNAKGSLRATISLVALIFVIKSLVNSLKTLGDLNYDQVNKGIKALGTIMIGLSFLGVALGYIAHSKKILLGTAALFAMVYLIQMMGDIIKELSTLPEGAAESASKTLDSIAKAMLIMAGAFGIVMAVLQIFDKAGNNFLKLGSGFGAILIGLAAFAGSLYLFKDFTPDQFSNVTTVILAVIGLFALIGVAVTVLSTVKQANTRKAMYAAIAAGLLALEIAALAAIFAFAFKDLKTKQINNIGRFLLYFAVAIGALGVIAAALGKWGGMSSVLGAAAVAIMVGSLVLLATTLSYLTDEMKTSKKNMMIKVLWGLVGAISVLGVLVGVLGFVFSKMVLGSAGAIGAGVALALIVGSMIILATALTLLTKNMSIKQKDLIVKILWALVGAISVLGVLIGVLGAVFSILPMASVGAIGAGITLAILVGSMAILGTALTLMTKNMTLKQESLIIKILWGMVGAISVLSIVAALLAIFPTGVVGAVTIGIIAASLAVLAATFAIIAHSLSDTELKRLKKILGYFEDFVLTIGKIGIAAGASIVGAVGLLALSAALVSFGLACLGAGLGILAAAAGFRIFIASLQAAKEIGEDGFETITKGAIRMGDIFPEVAKKVVDSIKIMADGITDSLPNISAATLGIVNIVFDAIDLAMQRSVDGIVKIFLEIVKAVKDNSAEFLQNLADAINEIADNIGPVFQAITHFIAEIFRAIGDSFSSGEVQTAMAYAETAVKTTIGKGLAAGLELANNAFSMAGKAQALIYAGAFSNALGIHSPSTWAYDQAGYIVEGMQLNFNKEGTSLGENFGLDITGGISSIVNGSKESLKETGSNIANAIASGFSDSTSFGSEFGWQGLLNKLTGSSKDYEGDFKAIGEDLYDWISSKGSISELLSGLLDIDGSNTINVKFDELHITGDSNNAEFTAAASSASEKVFATLLRRQARL